MLHEVITVVPSPYMTDVITRRYQDAGTEERLWEVRRRR